MPEEKKVNSEIEEMLTALGDPTPEDLKDNDDDKGEETDEEKAARETAEAEAAKLTDEEKAAKAKEDEDAEAAKLAEEEARKNETEEQKKEREDKEEEARVEADKKKEKEALDSLEKERQDREKAEKVEEERLKAEEDKKKAAKEPLKLDEQDFIGDLDLEELTRDKAAFNKILNAVYSKGVSDSKQLSTESVLSSIPEIVKHNLTLLTTLKEASDNFYKENADLTPFKRVVASVFEEIAAKNPDKKYGELMNLVAPEARKRLNLHEQAVKNAKKEDDKGGGTPRLHGAKGGQRQAQMQKPNTSAIEKEISEMNKTLGR